MQDNNTIGYYNNHADEFYKSTVEIDFSAMQEKFLTELKSGSCILDFGCGSGRDTRFFLEHGYQVDARVHRNRSKKYVFSGIIRDK